jgi:hypothetical protein
MLQGKLPAEFTVHAVWAVALLSTVWFLGVLRVGTLHQIKKFNFCFI